MKLATTTSTVSDYVGHDIEKTLEIFSKSRFRYLDYSFDGGYRLNQILRDNYLDEVEPALRAAEKYGMKFVQSHAPSVDPVEGKYPYEQVIDIMNRCIEICGKLSIPNMVVHSTASPKYLLNRKGDKQRYMEDMAKFYRDLMPACERNNVIVLAENSCRANMGDKYFPDRGYELAELVDAVGSPFMGAVWDTGHAACDNVNQYDDIMQLGKRLKALHVHDNFNGKDKHQPPFIGFMDGDGLMQGLIDSGYEGEYFTFEAKLLLYLRYVNDPKRPEHFGKHGNGSLRGPLPELVEAELEYLYEIGKYMLESYGLYEE